MAIERLQIPPRAVPLLRGQQTLYEAELSAEPSRAWRVAFLGPPLALRTSAYTPEFGRVELAGASVHFRTAPRDLHHWLHWIDRWIAYANSVVAG
jgi:hypothetical protein